MKQSEIRVGKKYAYSSLAKPHPRWASNAREVIVLDKGHPGPWGGDRKDHVRVEIPARMNSKNRIELVPSRRIHMTWDDWLAAVEKQKAVDAQAQAQAQADYLARREARQETKEEAEEILNEMAEALAIVGVSGSAKYRVETRMVEVYLEFDQARALISRLRKKTTDELTRLPDLLWNKIAEKGLDDD